MLEPGRKEDEIRVQAAHVFVRKRRDRSKLGVGRELIH